MTPAVSRSRAPRTRVTLLAGGAALLGLVAALLSPLSAQAAPVTLAGTVVGPTGIAAPALSVKLVAFPGGAEVATATTTTAGAFTFAAIDPGVYTLRFPATASSYAQYLGGVEVLADAQTLDFSAEGGKTTFVKAHLSAAGTITGTVTRAGSTTVIPGAVVTAYSVSPAGVTTAVGTATASLSGAYVIRGLRPGPYRLSAVKAPTYPVGYNGGATQLATAPDLNVSPGRTTTAALKLGVAGRVSGVVTSGGTGLAGVRIQGFRIDDSGQIDRSATVATTTATGAYTLTGLTPGQWTLRADTPDGSGIGIAFLGGADSVLNGERFLVASGASVTGKNFALGSGYDIQGSVFPDGGSTGLPRVRVSLSGAADDIDADGPLAETWTDASGYYLFTDLAPGDYVLTFGAFEASPLQPAEDTTWARQSSGILTVSNAIVDYTAHLLPRGTVTVASGPEITGAGGGAPDLRVGVPLEVTYSGVSTSGYTVTGTQQWYRDGVPIPGATGYRYSPVPADRDHELTVVLTRDDWSWGYFEWESPSVGPILPGPAPTVFDEQPSISGDPRVGSTIGVDTGTWEVPENFGESTHVEPSIVWEITWERSTDNTTYGFLEEAATHLVTAGDVDSGPYLRASLSGEVYGYDGIAVTTLPVTASDNVFTKVSSSRVVASTTAYTVQPGVYRPTPASFTYVWRVYDQSATEVATLSGVSIPKSAVAGKFVIVEVTPVATRISGTPETLVAQQGPKITVTGAATIGGTPRVGDVLTAPVPTVNPAPDAVTYAWQYLAGTRWVAIPGVSTAASSYLVQAPYLGKRIRVVATYSKPGYGPASLVSAATTAVALGTAPSPTVAPVLSGAPAANAAISVTSGTWSPAATSVGYQWRYGPTVAGPWTAITGARSASYTPPSSLQGLYLSVVVSAARTGHTTGSTAIIAPDPVAVGMLRNVITPTVKAGGVGVVAYRDTWTPAADTSDYIFVRLNENGTETQFATTSFSYAAQAPTQPVDLIAIGQKSGWVDGEVRVPLKNGTFQPATTATLGGVPKAGEPVSAVDPALVVTPAGTVFAYQWQRYTSATGWRSIPGATSASYQPVGSDTGKLIRVVVTVSAPRYTAISRISAGAVVQTGDALTPTANPVVFGTPRITSSPVVKPGTWNVPGATFTYQWQSAAAAIGPFTPIAGATAGSYKIPEALYGQYLRVVVTAKATGFANGTATTAPVQVQQGQLAAVTAPVVTKAGSVLTATAGTWNAAPSEVHYSWYRISLDVPETAEAIGTDSPSYTLTPSDAGRVLRVVVTAGRGSSWIGATQDVIAQRGPALLPLAGAGAVGTAVIGQTVSAISAGWNAEPTASTFQWRRNGVAIPGATSANYTLVAADLAARISVSVTATRTGHAPYAATLTLPGIVTSPSAPTLVAPPTVTGPVATLRVGDVATAQPGSWLAPGLATAAGVTFRYQWLRDGQPIGGATASTYPIAPEDLNHEIRVRVTASKVNYASATAESGNSTVFPGPAPVLTTGALTIGLASGSYRPNTYAWSLTCTETYRWFDANTFTSLGTGRTLAASAVASGTQLLLQITCVRFGHEQVTLDSATLAVP